MIDDILYKDIITLMEVNRGAIDYQCLGTEVLLLALISIEDSMTNLILKEMKITKEIILEKINNSYFIRADTKYTKTLQKVINRAKLLESEEEYVYDEAYLYSLLENKDNVALEILRSLQIEGRTILEELSNALDYLQQDSNLLINMTKLVKEKKTNPFIGRSDYIERIDRILSKKQKNNCMLIGPAGVGKSGLVEGLAQNYLQTKPNVIVYQLDLGALIAGTRYRGDLEEKLMDTLEQLKNSNCVLFIDEVHNILAGSSSENSLDIANLLKPYLARSVIKCIGATTTDEYYKTINKDKALARRFQIIHVNEPKDEECFMILKGIKKDYEKFHNIKYSNDILKFIIRAAKYNLYNNYPDKAIDMLDESGLITKRRRLKEVSEKIIKELTFENLGLNRKIIIEKMEKSDLRNDNSYEAKAYEAKAYEAKAYEAKAYEAKAYEAKAYEAKAYEAKAYEAKAYEAKAYEAKAYEAKAYEALRKYFNLNNDKYIMNLDIDTNENKNYLIHKIISLLDLNEEAILEIDLKDYPSEHHLSALLGTSPGYIGYDDGGILSNHILKHNISIVVFKNYLAGNIALDRMIKKIKTIGIIRDYKGNELNFLNSFVFFLREEKKAIGFIKENEKIKS